MFTSEEVKLLQAIANQAAVAIEHMPLIAKSHKMQEALAVRKFMEQAKGYPMRSNKLTEEEVSNSFSGRAWISGSRWAN